MKLHTQPKQCLIFMWCLQLINIETLGNPNGIGVFFPNGYVGAINKPTGYASMDTGLGGFPAAGTGVATQVGHFCAALLAHVGPSLLLWR